MLCIFYQNIISQKKKKAKKKKTPQNSNRTLLSVVQQLRLLFQCQCRGVGLIPSGTEIPCSMVYMKKRKTDKVDTFPSSN